MLAQTITGTMTDAESGKPLPFASIYLKGTTRGTTTNDQGKFTLNQAPKGSTLICRYVGYQKKEVIIGTEKNLNVKLSAKHKKIKTLVIKNTGEDPAYRIIRNAIKKRPEYNKEIDQFEANCYIKGKIELDETPRGGSILELTVEDSNTGEESSSIDSLKGILYLSETYSKITFQRKPKRYKVKVLSSKVSGSQSAYGFGSPMRLNFYENSVSFNSQISPRGLVSPIANGALRFYKYKLVESFFEDGRWINRIQVIPRRKFEPVFEGEIYIINDSWRIHSVDLIATKQQELTIFDTISIKQIHVPTEKGYAVKDQVFGLKLKVFGFGMSGNFVNVFTNYSHEIDPTVFDKFVMEYDSLALKQSKSHWDSIRVIPLEEEEVKDYIKKDSLAVTTKAKQDSMAALPFSYKVKDILLKGVGYKFNKKENVKTDALIGLQRLQYNTVEGLVYELPIRYNKKIDKDRKLYASAWGRYGFANQQLNAKAFGRYTWGRSNKSALRISGGRYIFQYNNNAPVDELFNSISTIFYGQNYLKIYRAYFAKASYTNVLFNGLTYKLGVDYQNRNALANATDFMLKWIKDENKFTANYPTEVLTDVMPDNSRLAFRAKVSYQPGRKLIKYPDRIVSVSSRYPTFYGGMEVARPLFNTDASYARWQAGMSGGLNLKLYGEFKYRWNVGGFLDKKTVFVPDFTHFNGNQFLLAAPYLNSFQLAPFYANSNTENFYTSFHAEHHFNGLGTNKIPMFRKLKYHLVLGSNGFYVNQNNNYIELSAGLENVGFGLTRFLRIDGVVGYQNFENPVLGIRVGINTDMFSLGSKNDGEE